MDDGFRIRPAAPADLAPLAALERACFSDPWSEAALGETLSAPHTLGLVAEAGADVVAYALVAIVRSGAEILTLGVAPRVRRRGVGRALLSELLERLGARAVQDVWLEVRASNLAAQALYSRMGFRPAGMRRAYYRSPREDALVLRHTLPDPRENGF
jgi:[ribosomal protein S18]-alanine N-acetyltransferase